MDHKPIDPHTLQQDFCDAFGSEALKAIGAVVAWAHIRAPREGGQRWGEIGIDRCGLLRWIQIDYDLLQLEGKFPNVNIGLFHNDAGGMKHIEISAGRFRLLLAHDSDPRTLVPISDYGRALAEHNQMSMFHDPSEKKASAATIDSSYAVLFHAKSETKGDLPYCLEIRFPDGVGGYAAQHLRLYNMFPSLMDETWLLRASMDFAAAVAPKEEKIKEEAMPKFRVASETGTA